METVSNYITRYNDIELKENYQPLEYIHWCAMGDDFFYVVEHILKKYPDYAYFLTNNNENGAFIATASNSVKILQIIEQYAPLSIRHISPYGNILTVAVDNNATDSWNYLINLKDMDYHAFCEDGSNLFLSICHKGDSDKLEELMNITEIDFSCFDYISNRSALYFVIDHYIKHQNNYLFEMILEKYTLSMLKNKDISNMTVIEFLYSKMYNQPATIKRILSPLEFSLKNAPLDMDY